MQRLIDVAFVHLGITDQRHHAAQRQIAAPVLGGDIVLHDRRKRRDRDAKADRSGREIDIIHVLGPAGVALHPTETAEILHLFAGLVAHQILDGVKERRGMGFDRDPVLWPQRVEIERCQDRHHRGRRRLMPADLDPVYLGPDVIGVMDHPVRQPQQALFNGFQMGKIRHRQLL